MLCAHTQGCIHCQVQGCGGISRLYFFLYNFWDKFPILNIALGPMKLGMPPFSPLLFLQ